MRGPIRIILMTGFLFLCPRLGEFPEEAVNEWKS